MLWSFEGFEGVEGVEDLRCLCGCRVGVLGILECRLGAKGDVAVLGCLLKGFEPRSVRQAREAHG